MRLASYYRKIAVGSLFAILALANISLAGLLSLPLPSLQLFTTLAWQASPSPEVVGYAVYYQVANLPAMNRVDVGKALSVNIPLLVGMVHSIYAVAYTADGVESAPSNVLKYTPPPITRVKLTPQPDGSMQLRFRTSPLAFCQVEWTPTLEPPMWQPSGLGLLVADAYGNVVVNDFDATKSSSRFYRARKL